MTKKSQIEREQSKVKITMQSLECRPLSVLFYFVPQESHSQAGSARQHRLSPKTSIMGKTNSILKFREALWTKYKTCFGGPGMIPYGQ